MVNPAPALFRCSRPNHVDQRLERVALTRHTRTGHSITGKTAECGDNEVRQEVGVVRKARILPENLRE